MAPTPKRTGSRNSQPASKTTVTKPEATDSVLLVTNPLDLWYLCEKVGFARLYPLKRSDGTPLYQRVVTLLVREDCRNFGYRFPYAGEVGYDMTKSPPEPIMSAREAWRPSEFPLSQYQEIKNRVQFTDSLGRFKDTIQGLMVFKELMTKDELENGLPLKERQSKNKMKKTEDNPEGLFRIPDVIRMRNLNIFGKDKFSQANLASVIEIKFPGDKLSKDQTIAYKMIAGNDRNFRLLITDTCDGSRSKIREWIRQAAKEPVYAPVAKSMHMAKQRLNKNMAYVQEYEVLTDLIDAEHEFVRQAIISSTIEAFKEPESLPTEPAGNKYGPFVIGGLVALAFVPVVGELALGGEVVAGGAIATEGATAGTAAAEGAITTEAVVEARAGAQVLQFPRVIRPIAAAAGTSVAADKLAAAPLTPDQPHSFDTTPSMYVYWPD